MKKNQTGNEYLSEIKKHAPIFIIVKNEFPSNVNWKYRKKGQFESFFQMKRNNNTPNQRTLKSYSVSTSNV